MKERHLHSIRVAVENWLSRGSLPSFTDSYQRVRNITLCGDGRICVTQFNTGNLKFLI